MDVTSVSFSPQSSNVLAVVESSHPRLVYSRPQLDLSFSHATPLSTAAYDVTAPPTVARTCSGDCHMPVGEMRLNPKY